MNLLLIMRLPQELVREGAHKYSRVYSRRREQLSYPRKHPEKEFGYSGLNKEMLHDRLKGFIK